MSDDYKEKSNQLTIFQNRSLSTGAQKQQDAIVVAEVGGPKVLASKDFKGVLEPIGILKEPKRNGKITGDLFKAELPLDADEEKEVQNGDSGDSDMEFSS